MSNRWFLLCPATQTQSSRHIIILDGLTHPYGWFQLEWPESWRTINIAAKELTPIVIAAALWGHYWKRSCVFFRGDNLAVVHILNSRTSKDNLLMHLLRCLLFYAALFGFQFIAKHVPGVLNVAADAISRNNTSLFLSLVPQIPMVAIPQPVLDLLIIEKPNWGSISRIKLFTRSLSRHENKETDHNWLYYCPNEVPCLLLLIIL